jgi:hypothetical protein
VADMSPFHDARPIKWFPGQSFQGPLVADRPREPVKSPPSGKLFQVAGCGRIFAGVGHSQGPGRLAQSSVGPNLSLGDSERREVADAEVHRLTSRGQKHLEDEQVVGRLVVADARLPRGV